VESRPKEKRTREFAASVRPVAKTTWLGSREPAEHAEPLDAQMPSMSNPAIKAMPSEPRTVKETVLASERARGETISQPGMSEIQQTSLHTKGSSFDLLKTGGFTNFSKAATKPMEAATFSVPARRSFSWPPPNKIGSGCSGDLIKSRPAPLGP